jgi:arsenate reductase
MGGGSSRESTGRPRVLFVCVENAGRSQMAEALLASRSGGRVEARSAGTRPASRVHPEVEEVLREVGLAPRGRPKLLGPEVTQGVDVVVTMGCGEECPVIPGARRIDWEIPDPRGRPLEEVRAIRDQIARLVEGLLSELLLDRDAAEGGAVPDP